MLALDDFITIGTQMKIERPGKACAITPCDEAEGPWVVLEDGRFLRIDEPSAYAVLRHRVKQVWDNGELVIGFGEFMENNKRLVPAGYTMDWWASDMIDSLSTEEDVAFFIDTIGGSREALPEGTPGLPPEECEDPNTQFWVRCEWHEHLRQLALTWPQALTWPPPLAKEQPPPLACTRLQRASARASPERSR